MKIYKYSDDHRYHGWYEVVKAPLATRSAKDNPNISDDTWIFIDKGSAFSAIFPTLDGQDTEEIEIDIAHGHFVPDLPKAKLFEKVKFVRDWVSEMLIDRVEENEAA